MKKVLGSKALLAFVFGFVMYILIMLPALIENGGILIIDGDNRTQAIPFSYHIRDALFSGNVVWDFSTGLGAQFLSSYAYYNLFSPFSIFYLIIPRSAIIYAVPYVSALKFGIGTMLAYFYIKRFVDKSDFAVIGGIVYMFSSFSAYNMAFHFADIIALFPLLLISLEELCVNRRRGAFALVCAFMACVNYYFFFGQAVFAVIYFFVRGVDRDFGFSVKRLVNVAVEAIIGVMIAMPVILPVAISLAESNKATSTMGVDGMLWYDNIFYYLKLIQSAFMIPDSLQAVSLFPASGNVYPFGMLMASVAAYLPLFSMAGVISYIMLRKKTWESILLIVCGFVAFVPVLNQLFSALNGSYYARWFYMPVLIAVVASVKALEAQASFKPGIIACSSVLAVMIIYRLMVDVEELVPKYSARAYVNTPITWICFAVSAVGIVSLILIAVSKRDKEFIPKLYLFTAVNVYICFGIMSFSLLSYVDDMDEYIASYRFDAQPQYSESTDRITVSGDTNNFNQIWQRDSINYFNSIHDPGFQRFLQENDMLMDNGLYIDIDKNTKELAGILSVRYLYLLSTYGFEDYEVVEHFGDYTVVENPYYVPMGFTYDYMMSYDDFSQITSTEDKHRVYAKYLVTDSPELFGDVLTLADVSEFVIDEQEYSQQLSQRRSAAALSTKKTSDGIVSQVELYNDELVFYSISYNDGWSAFVDGNETTVYDVNNGLIGVKVPEGVHEIKLTYTVRGFAEGFALCAAGVILFVAYLLFLRFTKKNAIE